MPPPTVIAGLASLFGIGSSRTELSDDEASDISAADSMAKATPRNASKVISPIKKEERLIVESDNEEAEEDEEDDDEVAEDEYVVEKILNHMFDEDGVLKFEVKWEGYEKKADRTWEPEENLETASAIVAEYLAKIGGKEALRADYDGKKAQKGKKRGRSSTGAEAGVNGTKKGKKNSSHPASETPPASAKAAEFKPPSGNWEEEVVGIDACEGTEGHIVVFLTWKSGDKSQHPLHQVYKRCPQKMLKFYENHLVFKKNDDDGN